MALLNLLLQGRREHSRPLLIAYVDLCAAFDSVDCNALWLLLRSLGIPPKLVDVFKDLCTDTVSCVRLEGKCQTCFTSVMVSGKAVQSLHQKSFSQLPGSLNARLTEGSWGDVGYRDLCR